MLARKIVETVRSVIGDSPAPLHEPMMETSGKSVNDCLIKNQVTQGEYVEKFEQMLCDFTGAKYAVATCNATCALHVSLEVLNLYYIKIPTITFIATANAAKMARYQIDLTECEKASLPVDLLGFKSMAKGKIRDSAQALGTKGIYGDHLTIHSFNGNKIITTGGGGAILTNDGDTADHIRHVITQSRVPHAWEIKHDGVGFNYRIPNINAALGCDQMEQLPYILECKRALAKQYSESFKSIGVRVWDDPTNESNHWLNAIHLENANDRVPVLQALHDAGYLARMLPTPLHMLPPYNEEYHEDLKRSEDVWSRTICLPSSPYLGAQYA
jgi:perosamine synthetase